MEWAGWTETMLMATRALYNLAASDAVAGKIAARGGIETVAELMTAYVEEAKGRREMKRERERDGER